MSAFVSIRKIMAHRILVRLAITGLITALGLSVLVASIQLFAELKNNETAINEDIDRIILATILPAKNAVYSYDYVLAEEIINSLLLNDFINAAWLYDENNTTIASGSKAERSAFRVPYLVSIIGEPIRTHTIELKLDDNNPKEFGSLKFEYNNHLPYRELMVTTWIRLALNVFQVVILTLVLIYVFNQVLTRPLRRLSTSLKSININDSQGQRLRLPYSHREDELGDLIGAINSYISLVEGLMTENQLALNETKHSYESLHALVENLPHLVNVKSIDGIALLANQAFLNTFGLTESEFISGPHNVVLSRFSKSTRQLIEDADEEAFSTHRSVLLPEVEWALNNGKYISLELRKLAIQYKGQDAILTVGVDITERKEHQAFIQHLAYHDSLTDLPNRHLFLDRLEQALLRSQRSKNYGALIFVDLDDFKTINDTKGHLVGDTILSEVANRLKEGVRDEDTVARLGGDEFVICMTGLGETEQNARFISVERANRLIDRMKSPFIIQGEKLSVSASLGLAFFNDHSLTASELLKHADMAMYKAKQSGKNKLILFEKEMAESNKRLHDLKEDCHMAIKENQFFLMYQPQMDSTIGKIIGAEALIRWDHPTRGLISPVEFIPLLEDGDLMPEVGEFVLQQAIKQASLWYKSDLIGNTFKMCINVSPQQFRQSDFTQIVKNIIKETDLLANIIDLEITEGMIIDNIDHTVASMNELRDYGIHFSIDDFGTGYSNLNYLKRLPLDVLKVDQSFVRDIQNDPNDAAIVRTILAMADQLKLNTVAEGVETEGQLELLKQMGCHVFQGYLYSPPLKTSEFEMLLNKQKITVPGTI